MINMEYAPLLPHLPDRQKITVETALHFGKVMAGKGRKIDAYLDKFSDFDVEEMRRLSGKKIKNLLIDIDSCVARAKGEILIENIEHIKHLQDLGVNLGIYSNSPPMPRLRVLYDMGLDSYEGFISKPRRLGFIKACERNQFYPDETWMIGDDLNTDGGAVDVLEGVAIVKPIPYDKRDLDSKELIGLRAIALFRFLSTMRSTLGNKEIIKSSDLSK